ncbi:MAG: hypothetical protein U0166_15775 [Acidobacteriota bacterium]
MLKYCRPSIDVVTHHIYDDSVSEIVRLLEGPRYPWESRSIRQIMQDNGMGDAPFYLTETGWTSATHGEQGQADLITQLFIAMTARPWWQKSYIYELLGPGQRRDLGHPARRPLSEDRLRADLGHRAPGRHRGVDPRRARPRPNEPALRARVDLGRSARDGALAYGGTGYGARAPASSSRRASARRS